MSDSAKTVDILIVNWNGKHFCEDLLPELLALPEYETFVSSIVVVDNGSSDGSVEYLTKNFPSVKVVALEKNIGYAKGNNEGLRFCDSEFTFLLNNDTRIIDTKLLSKLANFMAADSRRGAVGPALILPSGRLQTGAGGFDRGLSSYFSYFFFLGKIFPNFSKPFYFNQDFYFKRNRPISLDWLSGAAMLVRTSALKKIGGIPADYFMYSEDIKLCRNLVALGLTATYLPEARIVHIHGGSEDAKGIKTRWIESTLQEYQANSNQIKVTLAKIIFFCGFVLRAGLYAGRWLLKRSAADRLSVTRMLVYAKAALSFKVSGRKN